MYAQEGARMKCKTERITIRMTPEERRKLDYCSEKMGKTQSDILIGGLNNYYTAIRKVLEQQNK